MKFRFLTAACGLAMAMLSGAANAAGELNVYNWGDYTNMDMIKKFEETHDVKVTITDYDSNDTALAKVRVGGHGFDVVVPSANYVPIWISEGAAGNQSQPDGKLQERHAALSGRAI